MGVGEAGAVRGVRGDQYAEAALIIVTRRNHCACYDRPRPDSESRFAISLIGMKRRLDWLVSR